MFEIKVWKVATMNNAKDDKQIESNTGESYVDEIQKLDKETDSKADDFFCSVNGKDYI